MLSISRRMQLMNRKTPNNVTNWPPKSHEMPRNAFHWRTKRFRKLHSCRCCGLWRSQLLGVANYSVLTMDWRRRPRRRQSIGKNGVGGGREALEIGHGNTLGRPLNGQMAVVATWRVPTNATGASASRARVGWGGGDQGPIPMAGCWHVWRMCPRS